MRLDNEKDGGRLLIKPERLSKIEDENIAILRSAYERRKAMNLDWFRHKSTVDNEILNKQREGIGRTNANEEDAMRKRIFLENSAKHTILRNLGDVFSAYNDNNKRIFQISKLFAISRAAINTYEAVTKALTAYPPPWSFAAAASTAAFGIAQIDQIRSTEFGQGTKSSGSKAAVSGGAQISQSGGGTGNQTDNRGAGDSGRQNNQTVNIYVNGNLVDLSRLARELAPYNIEVKEDWI